MTRSYRRWYSNGTSGAALHFVIVAHSDNKTKGENGTANVTRSLSPWLECRVSGISRRDYFTRVFMSVVKLRRRERVATPRRCNFALGESRMRELTSNPKVKLLATSVPTAVYFCDLFRVCPRMDYQHSYPDRQICVELGSRLVKVASGMSVVHFVMNNSLRYKKRYEDNKSYIVAVGCG